MEIRLVMDGNPTLGGDAPKASMLDPQSWGGG